MVSLQEIIVCQCNVLLSYGDKTVYVRVCVHGQIFNNFIVSPHLELIRQIPMVEVNKKSGPKKCIWWDISANIRQSIAFIDQKMIPHHIVIWYDNWSWEDVTKKKEIMSYMYKVQWSRYLCILN